MTTAVITQAEIHSALVGTLNLLDRDGWQRETYSDYGDDHLPCGPYCFVGGLLAFTGTDACYVEDDPLTVAVLTAFAAANGIEVYTGPFPAAVLFNDTHDWPTVRAALVTAVNATSPDPLTWTRQPCRELRPSPPLRRRAATSLRTTTPSDGNRSAPGPTGCAREPRC
jgi:hypothetical protein